jgi:hypothetical protein
MFVLRYCVGAQAFPKLSESYFAFLLIIFRSHIGCLTALPPPAFAEIVATLQVRYVARCLVVVAAVCTSLSV